MWTQMHSRLNIQDLKENDWWKIQGLRLELNLESWIELMLPDVGYSSVLSSNK